jgi:FkbM family methyltransferase
VTDLLGGALARIPYLRRMTWRAGRFLYTRARREQIDTDIDSDGERYLQRCVLHHAGGKADPVVILDVGANQGDWTAALLSQAHSGGASPPTLRIECFEPVPTTRERLTSTLSRLDPAGWCRVQPFALSDVAGRTRMAIMSDTGGTNSLHFEDADGMPPGGWVDVETRTLAEFCTSAEIDHVHLLKCDAEGHDFRVINGARDLLAAGRIDVLQFEYNHRWIHSRTYLKDVFDLIKGLPYRCGRLEPASIEVFDTWHPELDRFFQSNYVLLSDKALSWFNTLSGSFDSSNTYA